MFWCRKENTWCSIYCCNLSKCEFKRKETNMRSSAEIKETILDVCCEDDCPVWLHGEVGQLLNELEKAIISENKTVS